MMRCTRAAFAFAVLASAACAQQAGDRPLRLVWDSLKGACPVSLDWTDLSRKVVAITLSAEPPSPEEIAEWNEVPEKLQQDPVVFIRVVCGSEFLLDQALERTPYRGCILFDTQRANAKNLGLYYWPTTTVLVDDKGTVAGYAWSGPAEKAVRSVLTHRPDAGISRTPPALPHYRPAPDWSVPAPDSVEISPGAKGGNLRLLQDRPNRFSVTDASLRFIITFLWQTPQTRIVLPGELDEGTYNVTASIPQADRDRLIALVRSAVERRFALSIAWEQRSEPAYVMTASEKSSRHRQPAKDDNAIMGGGGPDSIAGTAQTMGDIAEVFEELLETPVVDETKLAGKYDYSASSKLPMPERAFDLARQLGLELTQEERPVEMLVVRKIQ